MLVGLHSIRFSRMPIRERIRRVYDNPTKIALRSVRSGRTHIGLGTTAPRHRAFLLSELAEPDYEVQHEELDGDAQP